MKQKTLIVTVKSENFNRDQEEALKNKLALQLPGHNIAVLTVGIEDSVEIHEYDNTNYREEGN